MEGTIREPLRTYTWTILVFLLLYSTVTCLAFQTKNDNSYQSREWNNGLYVKSTEPLIPETSCFYENYKRTFSCECPDNDKVFSLNFKLGQHLLDSGKEIREVHFRHCNELDVTLNLRGIDATNYPIKFRAINRVNIKGVTFEPKYSDRQQLELHFYNVDKLFFNELTVRDTLEIHAMNVKDLKIINSTFAHVPIRGFTVSRAKSVEIQNSYFSRITRKSIVVDDTNDVLIAYNQMTINALEVVVAKDGSKLSIYCNRLLNQVPSPECIRTTTTTTTTTTTRTTTETNRPRMVKAEFPDHEVIYNEESKSRKEESEKGFLYEIIGGAIGGILVIVIIILAFLLIRKRNDDKSTVQENLVETTTSLNGVQFGSKPGQLDKDDQDENTPKETKETDSLILGNEDIRADEDDDEVVDSGPKFASPIWLEEIQKNKIFNRQKSLLSEDRLAELASAIPNEGDKDTDTAGDVPLNLSLSPLPDNYSQQRSPIHMEQIPETREVLSRLSRNASPFLDGSTHQQLQNDSLTALVSNEHASNVTNDDIVYNKQNEYAV